MKKLIAMILTFGLIFGTGAITKAIADFNVHIGKDRAYSSQYDRFGSWDARQRDRIENAYRDRLITGYEYNRLNEELSTIESFHDQALSKGWISHKDGRRLDRMESRLNADINREVSEHRG